MRKTILFAVALILIVAVGLWLIDLNYKSNLNSQRMAATGEQSYRQTLAATLITAQAGE